MVVAQTRDGRATVVDAVTQSTEYEYESRARGKAPKRCSNFSAVNCCSHLNISTSRGLQKKNSSDLSSRRRLTPKSDEFFVCTHFYAPYSHCPKCMFFTKMLHSFGARHRGEQRSVTVAVSCCFAWCVGVARAARPLARLALNAIVKAWLSRPAPILRADAAFTLELHIAVEHGARLDAEGLAERASDGGDDESCHFPRTRSPRQRACVTRLSVTKVSFEDPRYSGVGWGGVGW